MNPTLKLGDKGILKLVEYLVEGGYEVDPVSITTDTFTETIQKAVIAFQSSHVNEKNFPLREDGVVGPQTWWALEHPGDSGTGKYIQSGWICRPGDERAEIRPVLQVAVNEIGNREKPDGSNRGPEIDRYGGKGQPWCAYFVSWCFNRLDGGSPFGVLGSAYKLQRWAVDTHCMMPNSVLPIAGDIFVIMRESYRGHVGIIGSAGFWGGVYSVSTIEGNAGNAVRGLIRDKSSFTCLVRPIPLL